MRLTIEMHDPEGQLLTELGDRCITQRSIAITYAYLIAQQGDKADWPKINRAIMARWKSPTALARIKEMAWKFVGQWHERGLAAKEAGGA